MKYLRYAKIAALVLIAAALVIVALANRQPVMLSLLPGDMAVFARMQVGLQVPLFFVIFGGVALGLLIGVIWEFLREGRQRAEAAKMRREIARLTDELEKLRVKKVAAEGKDEVLALLEDTPGKS